jgi:N-acetylneuraminate lyase
MLAMAQRLFGLIAAATTPMNRTGEINPAAIGHQARLLMESGVRGVFVCGSTGECHSLSLAERMQVAEGWIAAAKDRLRVVIHVGSNSLSDARALAAHAERIGADAISTIAPFFFKPSHVDDLVDFCAAIAEAAPNLPFYYYHIPVLTGVHLPMIPFVEQAARKIPLFTGLKYTDEDLMTLHKCVQFQEGRLNVLFGRDEILLSALVLGVDGAVGSTYSYAAPVYLRVMEAVAKGDILGARREQAKAVEMVEALVGFGGLRATKAVMSMQGVDCGPVRLPLRPMTDLEIRALYEMIKHLDVFPRPLQLPKSA